MNLAPLTGAPVAIQLHTAAAMITILITVLIFSRARGTVTHKTLGWVWVGSMLVAAISSFWITTGGPVMGYSWIHLLSLFVVAGIMLALRNIRKGNIEGHRGWMIGMVWGALIVAGAFTLLPGRIMHAVLLSG